MANVPTISWDESAPSGSQERSLGATRLRELKTQVREVIGVDHKYDSSGSGATWGYHNKVTFTVQAADPAPDADTGVLYSKDVSSKAELHWVDEDDQIIQLTSAGEFVAGMAGEVRIYKGLLASIPTGWSLCDGTGGTPNLVGKHIRGVATGATDPGGTGGSDSVTLVEANISAHTHTLSYDAGASSAHTHALYLGTAGGASTALISNSGTFSPLSTYAIDSVGTHTHTIASAGSGTAFDNRPVYIEEGYIIKD